MCNGWKVEVTHTQKSKKKTHFLPEKAVSAMQKSISGRNAATAASRITCSAAATLELFFSPFWSGYTKKLLQVESSYEKRSKSTSKKGKLLKYDTEKKQPDTDMKIYTVTLLAILMLLCWRVWRWRTSFMPNFFPTIIKNKHL